MGTVCAFDSVPREVSDQQIERLEDIAELARAHLELVRVATDLGQAAALDPLTEAVNRVIFHDRLAQALARRRRRDMLVLVAMIDLNDFKALNDSHGHEGGDAALRWTVDRLGAVIAIDGDDVDSVIQRADRAMYAAKPRGSARSPSYRRLAVDAPARRC